MGRRAELAAPRGGRRPAREHARAVLRPRLRLRHHAGVAPAARAPRLAGRGAVRVRAARGLVVVELHRLGHERAQPRLDRGPPAADRADAAQPADGDRDPRRLRGAGAPVRGQLRGDPDRAPLVPHVRGGRARHDRAPARGAHPRLVRGGGRALDRGRARGGGGADDPVARGAGARLRRPARDLLAAGTAAHRRRGVGDRHGALRRALPAVHHHRPRRDDRHHRRDDGRARADDADRGRLRARLPVHGRAVVALLQLRRRGRGAGARAGRPTARCSRATPTPTCTSCSSRASCSPRSATSS